MSTDIYVLLTDTGTMFTKMIRTFTRDPLNHASLSFDIHLTEVYSFGRKNPSNPFLAGFVKENLRDHFFQNTNCAIYRCSLSTEKYNSIRNEIFLFEQNQNRYRYNLLGIFGVLFNIEWQRDHAFFCSQFVATVFERSGVSLVDKSPLLVKPGDLQHTTQLELVYQGKLQSYMPYCEYKKIPSPFQTA
ncbi:hypothetical protein ACFSTH_16090 [Paenibacillus yanchengensis]|uniref:Uncharacterized protein n=1 Tax=Paenibacillus yanchengensis TaxID=2035833 RepID=A0ABW4YGJ2_9BACL